MLAWFKSTLYKTHFNAIFDSIHPVLIHYLFSLFDCGTLKA